jgi:RNA polymerase sigma factor (sigma-70 family)
LAVMRDAGQENATGSESPQSIDWSAILARHDRWLRTAIFARLREIDGVDEVMQAVAVAAVEQRAPLVDLNKVAPWLYRLAIWQTLLYRRRAGRQRKLAKNYGSLLPANNPAPGKTDPLDWLLSDERQRLVRTALERLSRQDVEVLLLKYSEDWTYGDLAAHLGISESAVEARLHRARGRLRHELVNLNVTGE